MRSFSFAKGQQAFKTKPVKITQKEHLLIWNSETSQNLNIYVYNYQTETAIFPSTNNEKTIMTCSCFNFLYFLHFELLASNTIKNESICLNSWHHSHKKQKMETGVILLIFLCQLKISGVVVQRIHQNSKQWCFCEEFLNENEFEAVLTGIILHTLLYSML